MPRRKSSLGIETVQRALSGRAMTSGQAAQKGVERPSISATDMRQIDADRHGPQNHVTQTIGTVVTAVLCVLSLRPRPAPRGVALPHAPGE